jgi:putative oxidoreductase
LVNTINQLHPPLPPMKIAATTARLILGLIFVVFGVNAFLHFLPAPPMQGPSAQFMGVLVASHYLYAIKCFEIAGGLLLLIGRYVPLGLTLLGPVIVNILFFHIFLDTSGLPVALIISALALFLLVSYRSAFAGLLRA